MMRYDLDGEQSMGSAEHVLVCHRVKQEILGSAKPPEASLWRKQCPKITRAAELLMMARVVVQR